MAPFKNLPILPHRLGFSVRKSQDSKAKSQILQSEVKTSQGDNLKEKKKKFLPPLVPFVRFAKPQTRVSWEYY